MCAGLCILRPPLFSDLSMSHLNFALPMLRTSGNENNPAGWTQVNFCALQDHAGGGRRDGVPAGPTTCARRRLVGLRQKVRSCPSVFLLPVFLLPLGRLALAWWETRLHATCRGAAIKATRGDAIFFWALKPDGTKDRSSLHGSCPTTKVECFCPP